MASGAFSSVLRPTHEAQSGPFIAWPSGSDCREQLAWCLEQVRDCNQHGDRAAVLGQPMQPDLPNLNGWLTNRNGCSPLERSQALAASIGSCRLPSCASGRALHRITGFISNGDLPWIFFSHHPLHRHGDIVLSMTEGPKTHVPSSIAPSCRSRA